jgi:acetoin utilization deacetylase AcuC-like enzyme
MTLLYYDPIFLEHKTGGHPENPNRLLGVMRQLQLMGLDCQCNLPAWAPISPERLARVHPLGYTEAIRIFCQQGGGLIEHDTMTSRRSYEVALMAAGAVCDSVERVLRGDDSQSLCLVRPPGHHALSDQAMGFCLLNHVALGARLAVRELELDHVLIVDWDVHHGNGTQAIFWEDPQVGYLSIHRWPFYPGTGAADETGSGPGLGTTVNLPVEYGISRKEYLQLFTEALGQFADDLKPDLILISAGFDSHRADPVGSLNLESEDFQVLTRSVLEVAQVHCDGRVVSVLEGGYNPDALTECVEIHLEQLLEMHS